MKTKMTATLRRWARRLDALSLRERVVGFVAAIVLLLTLLDQAVVQPALQASAQRQALLRQQADELQRLRQQLASLTRDDGSERARELTPLREALAQAQRRQAGHAAATSGQASPAVVAAAAAELPALLRQLLMRQHPQVVLEALQLQARAPLTAAPAATATTPLAQTPGAALSTATSANPAGGPPGWQATELRLRGPYAALVSSLQALETGFPQLRWGEAHLQAPPTTTDGPPQLRLRVWTPQEPAP
ncbi:YeaH/YhbH family protein [Ideonella livida]|uniref:YeaH/YhbH family protein n=1 Tax=Ideonella livida TaxID=2707176 RepID=A0A7C9PEH9_9BURK|nr:YeaH/YhbH family protein [Ideonella livida]NDY89873.1 YeaH/YhbH family protein [Ideonella livida]